MTAQHLHRPAQQMEQWSFPARYDNTYFPSPSSPYWFPNRETMDPELRNEMILVRLREVMRYAQATSALYRRKWGEVGLEIGDITSFDAFEQVPVITKADLRESQTAHPPYGDYLCAPEEQIHHIHGTSGTTGTPTTFAIGRNDWEVIANNHARILWGMGIRPGDTVFVAAVFSLYLGSWGALSGAERLHCRVFPFGAGAPGMTARAVRWLEASRPAAFYATPSYALRLAEVAAEQGVDPKSFGIKVMFFSGEPGASVPSVRSAIADTFGATVIDCGTMAEMSPFMSASATAGTPEGMLLWQDIVYHEVCDPHSYRTVPYGGEGTPVYTHLERTSQPMIRLASGDLTSWEFEDNPCGRTYPRLPRGVYGRIDDMLHIRGENVYPTEIDNTLRKLPDYGGEHRIIVTRTGAMDEMLVRIEHAAHDVPPATADDFRARAAADLHSMIGLRVSVEVLPARSFERTDHKARRVDDRRNLS